MYARASGVMIPMMKADRSRRRSFRSLPAIRVAAPMSVAERFAGEMQEHRLEIGLEHLDGGHACAGGRNTGQTLGEGLRGVGGEHVDTRVRRARFVHANQLRCD